MPSARRAGRTCASKTEPWLWTLAGWSTCWWRTRSIASASALDGAVLNFARRRGHDPFLERALAIYSRTGEHAACWLGLGLAGAALTSDADRRRQWLHGVRVVAGSYAFNYAVKIAVRRPRPQLPG